MYIPRRQPLHPRQNDDINSGSVPASYGALNSSPTPGAVVGIVLGAVAGFILLLWLVYTCLNFGPSVEESSYVGTGSVLTLRSRRSRPRRRSRSRSRARVTETVEVRTREHGGRPSRRSGGPPPPIIVDAEPGPDVGRVYVDRRGSSRVPPPRVVSVVSDSDDEVIVVEDHSPPPRRGSRRRSGSRVRRNSVYREEYDRRSSRRMSRHS